MNVSDADNHLSSLRPDSRENERLVAILLASLMLHLLFWGGYEIGEKLGWWDHLHWPAWLHHTPKLVIAPPPPQVQPEAPLEFVSVDEAAPEPPKNAKFYSSQNSQAADQSTEKKADMPKVDGKQTDMTRLEDALRPQRAKPQPPEPKQPTEEKTAQPAKEAGDTETGQIQPEQTPARPRTLKEVKAQQNQTQGVKSRIDGGAIRHNTRVALDAVGTPFGDYDQALIDAIQQFWDDELDSRKFALDRSGKVAIQFKLYDDGSVRELQETENTVGMTLGLVCQDAINGPAPFAKWPPAMRQAFGKNFRVITFTFYYY
jgi:hypothetical protein